MVGEVEKKNLDMFLLEGIIFLMLMSQNMLNTCKNNVKNVTENCLYLHDFV